MQASVDEQERVLCELRRQACFMKEACTFLKREGRALLVPTPPRKTVLGADSVLIGGSCVACGQGLSSKHAAGVYYLPCFHKYHPFCFSIVCATEPKCIVPDCRQDIPLVARCWALGNAYEGKACLFYRT